MSKENKQTISKQLAKCPFCNEELEVHCTSRYYMHKLNGCILQHFCFETDDELSIDLWNTRKPMERIVERLEERTEYFKDCKKYGNETEEQEERSYSAMMMYEVAGLVDDLIEIVKEEGGLHETTGQEIKDNSC